MVVLEALLVPVLRGSAVSSDREAEMIISNEPSRECAATLLSLLMIPLLSDLRRPLEARCIHTMSKCAR